jgi:hypothetical protein
MNNVTTKVKRRDFLSGAAAAIGVGLVGSVPEFASGQVSVFGPANPTSLFYWTGFNFIPAAAVIPQIINGDSVTVQIDGYGASPNIAAIDVQMPGGLFHAFTSSPMGLQTSLFTAPIASPLGLTLIVSSPAIQTTFALLTTPNPGPKLALGTYLLIDTGAPATSYQMAGSATAPVTLPDGQPVTLPYSLITVTGYTVITQGQ